MVAAVDGVAANAVTIEAAICPFAFAGVSVGFFGANNASGMSWKFGKTI